MIITKNQIDEKYWRGFSISNEDLEFLYNLLLDREIPLSTETLVQALITFRIEQVKINSTKNRQDKELIYFPKDEFEIGDIISFPSMKMKTGKVINKSDGFNPEFDGMKVIEVKFNSGETKSFASKIENHPLNHILDIPEDNPNYNPNLVFYNYHEDISNALKTSLYKNDDLVNIAGNWFPRSLLVDVHVGHLNLAEAVLEEANGGPLGTIPLMDQVELNAKADKRLLEFSFDLALQEDERFDEVGPAGETLWFLHEKEPDQVKKPPEFLVYDGEVFKNNSLEKYMTLFEDNIYDELEDWESSEENKNYAEISLTLSSEVASFTSTKDSLDLEFSSNPKSMTI